MVETNRFLTETTTAFGRGLISGDVSTPAGIAGDIAMGFIPFGDSRDIALQNYYKHWGDASKYNEVVLYLSYIGLGADALMLIPASTVVGAPLNAAVAVIKPAVKLITNLPFSGVLAKQLADLAKMAQVAQKTNDWSGFQRRAQVILPILQLFAAVALDDDLRTLLANAVRNSVDFENWLKWIGGAPATLTAYEAPDGFKLFFPEAHAAAMSGFKALLRAYVTHSTNLGVSVTRAGEKLADIVAVMTSTQSVAWINSSRRYQQTALKALSNVHAVGGRELTQKLSEWVQFGRRSVDDVMDDIATLNVSAMSTQAKTGYKTLLAELAAKGNKAKGAAHHLKMLRKYQDQGYKIINVEITEAVVISGTRLKHQRRFDAIVEAADGTIIRLEAKSWLSENIVSATRSYLLGKAVKSTGEYAGEGAQLFSDLLSYAQNGFKGHKWVFDDGTLDGGAAFKNTIKKALESEGEIRKRFMTTLEFTDDQFDNWIDILVRSLDNFVEVI